jgi:hypothetical protein
VKKLLLLSACALLCSCAELNQLIGSVTGNSSAQLELTIKGAPKTTSKVSFSGADEFFFTDDGRSFTVSKVVKSGTYKIDPEAVPNYNSYVQFSTPNGNQSVIGAVTMNFESGKTYKVAVEYIKLVVP